MELKKSAYVLFIHELLITFIYFIALLFMKKCKPLTFVEKWQLDVDIVD